MKLLNEVEVVQRKLTLGKIRHMVRDVRNEFNVRIMDVTDNDPNLINAKMLSQSDKLLWSTYRNGKLYTNKPIEYMTKAEAIDAYNDYIQLLNMDTTTKEYRKKIREEDKEKLKHFNKARKEHDQTPLTMQQFQEFSRIVEDFDDLFDDNEYYREVIDDIKNIRRRYKSKKSLLEFLKDAKDENPNASQKEIYDRAIEMALLTEKEMREDG